MTSGYGTSQQGGDQQGGYTGPPPTGHSAPSYDPYGSPGPQAPPYGQQGPPPAAPYGYAYPPPYAVAYPPPGFAYAYAPVARGESRPGVLTAAAVLGYIEAGLLLLAGLILYSGSEIVSDLDGSHSTELALDATLNLVAAGLLIAGAIMVTARQKLGQLLYSAGSAIVLALTVYWQLRWSDDISYAGIIFYGGLFATLLVIGTALLWAPDGTTWLRKRPQTS